MNLYYCVPNKNPKIVEQFCLILDHLHLCIIFQSKRNEGLFNFFFKGFHNLWENVFQRSFGLLLDELLQ